MAVRGQAMDPEGNEVIGTPGELVISTNRGGRLGSAEFYAVLDDLPRSPTA
jgi:hypothetical protein